MLIRLAPHATPGMHGRVEVREELCRGVASAVRGIRIRYIKTVDVSRLGGREPALRLLFYYMAINHDTRGVQGFVDGRQYRGSQYLYHAMRVVAENNPDAFGAERMANLTLSEFMGWFVGGTPPRRPMERVALLRDAAEVLRLRYGGCVGKLLEECGGYVGGSGGLVDRLREFRAYSDPLAKKSMVFAMLLQMEGLFTPRDPWNITVGVDYHLQRVALRTGMVEVVDEGLRRKLLYGRFVSEGEHMEVRKACLEAYKIVGENLNWDATRVDQTFWHLGRSCCRYMQPPCGENECKERSCTLQENSSYRCRGRCPLNGVCMASVDGRYLRLREPKVITYFY